MLQIQAKENKCIDLGRRGEDSAREILFDISGWAELYGQGEAHLIAKRDKDLKTYPVEITQDNTTVRWVVKPVDNDQPGYGNCELVYITDGSVVKSIIYQTHTDVSLSDPISPPDSPDTYSSIRKDIGNLSELHTKEKGSLVSAINELFDNGGANISGDCIYLQSCTPGSNKMFKITVNDSGAIIVTPVGNPDDPDEPEVPEELDVIAVLGVAKLGELQLGSN